MAKVFKIELLQSTTTKPAGTAREAKDIGSAQHSSAKISLASREKIHMLVSGLGHATSKQTHDMMIANPARVCINVA
jgi:hypothetical protein